MNGRHGNRVFWGFVLIGLGAFFLLAQLDLLTLDIGQLFSTYWPVLLIAFGLKGLAAQRKYGGFGGQYVWNLFVVALGAAFLLKNTGALGDISYGELMRFSGPAILIVIGLGMMFRGPYKDNRNDPANKYEYKPDYKIPHPDELSGNSAEHGRAAAAGMAESIREEERAKRRAERDQQREERARQKAEWNHQGNWDACNPGAENRSSFFGDVHLGTDYWELKPLNISHFVGDTVIDLTRAQIPYGETTINISAFIGDVKIFMPYDSHVEISVSSSSFLGDIRVLDRHESGFMRSMNLIPPHYADAEKKIRLRVSMFIGDVKVQRVG